MNVLGLILLLFNLTPLHEAGYQGQGMTIAVIDAGFFRANDSTVFPQDQILGVYNMLEGDSLAVDTFGMFNDSVNVHGTMVLSTMLYQDTTEGGFIGTAPKASFYLIKSEDIYAEYYEEVERLARAFRLADSLDVDIVTVSLGYSLFNDVDGQPNPLNFTYADMDGRTSPASRAATELVRKGRFVVVAAGNDGNKPWHYVATPADADSILSVGAVNVNDNDSVAPFSSYGPTYDGRLKPETSGSGWGATVYKPAEQDEQGNYVGAVGVANGTSFAAPATAGMVACLWQAMPNLTSMELRELIMQSSSLYPLHEDQRGYGVPDAWLAFHGPDTALPEVRNEDIETGKRIENGQLFILRGGVKYTVLGVIMQKND